MPDVSAAGQLIADDAYSSRNQSKPDISQVDELARDLKGGSYNSDREDSDSDDELAWTPSPLYNGRSNVSLDVMHHSLSRDSDSFAHTAASTAPTPRRTMPAYATTANAADDASPTHGAATSDKRALRRAWWRSALINCMFIAAWYFFSTLISLYNKWMFSSDHFDFPFPLFVTSVHMLVQWSLAALTLTLVPSLRQKSRPTPVEYGTKVAPCGIATGLDIGLSNLSLRTVTLSFYTMCKSSSLAFVLIFAFLFRLERPSIRLIGIILIITAGVILMVSSETHFQLFGMVLVLSASAFGGLRWSLTQILLDKEHMGMGNPIATLYWLAPIMGATLATVSMIVDGWFTVFSEQRFFGSLGQTLWTVAAILFPGVLAFSMNVTEFGLIQRTSVVTLSVAGIFKEVAVIFLSTLIFNDQLTPINISGLAVTIFGIALYNYFKYQQYTAGQVGRHGQPLSKDDGEEAAFVPLVSQQHSSSDDQPFGQGGGFGRARRPSHRVVFEAPDDYDSHLLQQNGGQHHLHKASEGDKELQHDRDAIPLLEEHIARDDFLQRLDEEEDQVVHQLDEAITKHKKADGIA